MKFILDTHIFLWALAAPEKIEEKRRIEIQTRSSIVYVSSITFAELMIKASVGKLTINFNPMEAATESGFEFLAFSSDAALYLKDLPFHHKDPFDRMLICQSMAHGYPLMTDDKKIKQYNCNIL